MNKRVLFLFFSALMLIAVSACSNYTGDYREGSVNPPAARSLEDRVIRQNRGRETRKQRTGAGHRQHTQAPFNQGALRSSAAEPSQNLPDSMQPMRPTQPMRPASNPGPRSEASQRSVSTPYPRNTQSRHPVEVAPDSVLIVKPSHVPPFEAPRGAAEDSIQTATSKPAPAPSVKPEPKAQQQPTTRTTGRELSSHSTEFNAKEEDRVTNITRASNSINGHIVKPGETFSYNQTVGPTIERRGYKKGVIFVDGEKKEGFGGGVCQVSTTLSIAADEAGMTITERHDHSLPVTYAQEGEEAATSYGVIDFKFKNDEAFPIVIHSSVHGGTISVRICEAG